MATDLKGDELNAVLGERLKQLPKVVQDAILSADVEAHMRELAEHHKLHFDQWTALENEVMFALLGFEPVENLAANIEKEVGTPHETALALAGDISHIVFEPVRAALEASLAQQQTSTPLLNGAQAPSGEQSARPTVLAGTPPPSSPELKAIRAPISESYQAQQASHERKSVEGDPYREQPI